MTSSATKMRRWILAGSVALVIIIALAIGWTRLVPIGASIQPFLLASTDEGHTIADQPYRIIYNDAGAMHSGNFWTWIIRDYGVCRVVVREGYSSTEVRKGRVPFPVRKVGGRTEIGFAKGRRDNTLDWVPLP